MLSILISLSIVLVASPPNLSATEVGAHVVFISDSHGNCEFGEHLNQLLRSVNNSYIHSLAIGGSSPDTWLRPNQRVVSPLGIEERGYTREPVIRPRKLVKTTTPYFPDFLQKSFAPNATAKKLTVINLGTNSLAPINLQKDSARMVRVVFEQESDCAWVSPPNSRRWSNEKTATYYQAVRQGIEAAGEGGPSNKKCLLIDSGKLTNFPPELPRGPTVDGVHYCWHPELIKRANLWAENVFSQIKSYFALDVVDP
ncbi:MAG: hypothetical protein HYV97_02385 [Bdellovibrio sp.]|nr:hypothetical protein [Bdellovibrio sp.]